jgi:hypothetical protein
MPFQYIPTSRKSEQLSSMKNAASSSPSALSLHHKVRETLDMILRSGTKKSASKIPNTEKSRLLISNFEALKTFESVVEKLDENKDNHKGSGNVRTTTATTKTMTRLPRLLWRKRRRTQPLSGARHNTPQPHGPYRWRPIRGGSHLICAVCPSMPSLMQMPWTYFGNEFGQHRWIGSGQWTGSIVAGRQR